MNMESSQGHLLYVEEETAQSMDRCVPFLNHHIKSCFDNDFYEFTYNGLHLWTDRSDLP